MDRPSPLSGFPGGKARAAVSQVAAHPKRQSAFAVDFAVAVSQVATHALSVTFGESGKPVTNRRISILCAIAGIGANGKAPIIATTVTIDVSYADFTDCYDAAERRDYDERNACHV